MIARLDLTAINDFREALPQFAHIPLAYLHHLTSDQRLVWWLDEISQSLADESSIVLGSMVSGTLNGLVVYNDSRWDSQITRRRLGTVKHLAVIPDDHAGSGILRELIDELLRSLAKRRTQCVVCRVQSNELAAIHALEQSGFLLMDTLLDFVFDFSRTPIERIDVPRQDEQLKIREAKAQDLTALMEINESAFADYFGRYHADPQMPPGTATRIYAEWARSALHGWADWIVVAEIDGKTAGCGLWRNVLKAGEYDSPGVAYCDMVVVDPEFQGRGVGTALMVDGMRIAPDCVQYLVGPVHVCNYPVQRTLQKLGWKIAGARHSFHKWLEE
jgi:ribosomal protein S18 acetylase RimI-like enzyme